MSTEEETRKALHELRNSIQELKLETTRANMEAEKNTAVLQGEVRGVAAKVEQMVTRLEFTPVKLLVYGMAAIILSGALGATLSLIFVKGEYSRSVDAAVARIKNS